MVSLLSVFIEYCQGPTILTGEGLDLLGLQGPLQVCVYDSAQ